MAAAPYGNGRTRQGEKNSGDPTGDNDRPPDYAPDMRRIIETLIPAAVVGVIVLWGSMQVLGNDIQGCKERIMKIESIIDRMRSDMYAPRWSPSGSLYRHPLILRDHESVALERGYWI